MDITDPLERIGVAFASDIWAHGEPLDNLYVTMGSWEDEAPSFGCWPCPVNPKGDASPRQWSGTRRPNHVEVTLCFLDVSATRVAPRGTVYNLTTSICSDFICHERFFADDATSKRAPNLYLPGPGLAHIIPKLRTLPHVTVCATYSVALKYSGCTLRYCTSVHLLSRFGSDATFARTHNTHLLDACVPSAWIKGKQFGDAKRRHKTRKRKRKHANDSTANPKATKRTKVTRSAA